MAHENLKKIPCLSRMTTAEFSELVEILVPLSLQKGTVLFREGDKNQDLYFVTAGKFSVTKSVEEIAKIQAPSIIGEMAFLIQQPRSATVTVTEDADLFRLKKEDFIKISRKNPAISMKILEFFAQILSHRLYELDTKVCEIISKNSSHKPVALAELEAFRNKLTTQWSF